MTRFSRAQLLSRTATGGLALVAGGSVIGATASSASGAIGPSDIPEVTQALATELLGAVFYTQLLAAKKVPFGDAKYYKRALLNETDHYTALAKVLTDAGQTPGQPADFNFTFPDGSFDSYQSASKLGMELETIFLGIYLGGAASIQHVETRSVFARIAASQAQHLSLFSATVLNKPIGVSFPLPLSLDEGSVALDPFIS